MDNNNKLDLTKYEKKHEETPKKTNTKKDIGRPTKYKPEYAEMLIEFFSVDPTIEKETVYKGKDGKEWSKMERVASYLPTFERFAENIGVDDKTLENWYKAKRTSGSPRYPEFFRAYIRAKQMQKDILIQNGLLGGYNARFALFVAMNATDMREKVEVPLDGKGNPVPIVAGFQIINPKGNKDVRDSDDNTTD